MADFVKNLLGGLGQQKPLNPAEDPDFADFAGAPSPAPASTVATSVASSLAQEASAAPGIFSRPPMHTRPYTKWYRVWERVTIEDFYTELMILPIVLLVVIVHVWGSRANRGKARRWITAHAPVLEQEYALVGFEKLPNNMPADTTNVNKSADPFAYLKEKSVTEYTSYATGRQNVAFTDIKINLLRRQNPMGWLGEEFLGFVFESQPAPRERVEATTYVFDGKEHDLAPLLGSKIGADGITKSDKVKEKFNSTYDGFVFAVVHKDKMKSMRESRYDISLTVTKDHQRLPPWAATMSESAEITDAQLTPELVKCLEGVEGLFESLIVTDMPIDKPKSLADALPSKRITLSMKVASTSGEIAASVALFRYFTRLPDFLVSTAHYRIEALRRVRATRDEEMRKIKKAVEEEKAEERKLNADKAKKLEREERLRGLSADEQRKALERERAQDLRRGQKKKTMKA